MRKIYFKDGSSETVSSDLLKSVNEFREILREKLGDDSEKLFSEIVSDVFDLGVSETELMNEPGFDEYVKNPFFL
jgi:hypothetical protein